MSTTWQQQWRSTLGGAPSRWVVTGAAGFIGSHLVETLLALDQAVVGFDNLATGTTANLDRLRARLTAEQWSRFRWIAGDITQRTEVDEAVAGAKFVLHQAALGSVPLSIDQPLATHAANVTGFVNVLLAARDAGVSRVVYASSSAVYGDSPAVPAREGLEGQPLSPYAASKAADELYSASFRSAYGLESVGLRYFNVLGPRQDPAGAYAAVVPRWIAAFLRGAPVEIFGDGSATRDFCPVANVVHANLLAATRPLGGADPRAFNVGLGDATTLNELFRMIRDAVARWRPQISQAEPVYRPARAGDILHSCADISRLRATLGFVPAQSLAEGMRETVAWFVEAAG